MCSAPHRCLETSLCKNIPRLLALVVALWVLTTPAWAQGGPPLLEEYLWHLGDSGRFELTFLDPNISRGGAQFRFTLQPANAGEYHMRLEVFRHVNPGTVTFALLLERIEVAFWDGQGELVRKIVVDQALGANGLFIIGDSADGYFQHARIVPGLATARRITVRLLGNYE
jgi:hypothetical protein